MNSNDTDGLILHMPSAWDSFGQWLVYGILAAMVITVIIFMYKMLFPSNKNDSDNDKD